MTYTPGCWFAQNVQGVGSCDGQLIRCHLIPKQQLRRMRYRWRTDGVLTTAQKKAELARVVWDERVWVWGCGGPTGIGGHHGMLDYSRTLRIPRHIIPEATEEFAAEHGLTWWLDREYGLREQAA